jgi:uncharacterized protein
VILYLDTSALVKLYVDEAGSDVVMRYVQQASVVATSKIAFVEARSAFARAKREGILSDKGYRQSVERLRYDWKRYMIVEISDALIEAAGEMTDKFSLRGFDALHLSSALLLQQQTGHQVSAACWDSRLWDALKELGFDTVPENRPGQ